MNVHPLVDAEGGSEAVSGATRAKGRSYSSPDLDEAATDRSDHLRREHHARRDFHVCEGGKRWRRRPLVESRIHRESAQRLTMPQLHVVDEIETLSECYVRVRLEDHHRDGLAGVDVAAARGSKAKISSYFDADEERGIEGVVERT